MTYVATFFIVNTDYRVIRAKMGVPDFMSFSEKIKEEFPSASTTKWVYRHTAESGFHVSMSEEDGIMFRLKYL
jgi:hypothetical protein